LLIGVNTSSSDRRITGVCCTQTTIVAGLGWRRAANSSPSVTGVGGANIISWAHYRHVVHTPQFEVALGGISVGDGVFASSYISTNRAVGKDIEAHVLGAGIGVSANGEVLTTFSSSSILRRVDASSGTIAGVDRAGVSIIADFRGVDTAPRDLRIAGIGGTQAAVITSLGSRSITVSRSSVAGVICANVVLLASLGHSIDTGRSTRRTRVSGTQAVIIAVSFFS